MAKMMARTAIRGALLLASASSSAAAWAQVDTLTPRATIDENGVDLSTGRYLASFASATVGNGSGALTWTWGRDDIARSSFLVSGGRYYVSVGEVATIFTLSGGQFVPVEKNGATLVNNNDGTYTFTNATGEKFTFRTKSSADNMPSYQGDIIPDTLKLSDGSVLTFDYEKGSTKPNSQSDERIYWMRLRAVRKSTGYVIQVRYQQQTLPQVSTYPAAWLTRTGYALGRATTCNNSYTSSCPQRVSVNSDNTTFTDALGNVTSVTTSGNSTRVRLPGSTSDDVVVTYSGGKVQTVAAGGVTTSYGFSDSGDQRTVTVIRGSLPAREYAFKISTRQILRETWRTTASGTAYNRTYDYSPDTNDPNGTLLKRITNPDESYTKYAYDPRGNVKETRLASKTPGTPADIVTTATYDATCSNPVTCNQPNTTTNALNRVTNYYYDATHGGVTTIIGPAPDPAQPSIRPRTDITYKQIGPDGTASNSGTWVQDKITRCATASTCTGSADEVVTTFSYGYGLDVTSVKQAAGNNAVSATTTMGYDAVGNLISVDGPQSGGDDTTRMRYDAVRRVIGKVGPDPDGNGARLAVATRTSYNADGTVSRVEQGTDSTPTASDFSGFTSMQQVDTTYDGYHRKTKDTLSSGDQAYAVSQQSYDSLGRIDCTVTRLDPSQWGNQTDACQPQLNGPKGPDRVTRRYYDGLSRIERTTVGFGTGAASIESVAYAVNGQVETVSDGNSNVTSYTYDGVGRLDKTTYSGGSFEQLGYDAAGNVRTRRLRSGQTVEFTYDDLNRLKLNSPPGERAVAYRYDLLGRLKEAAYDGIGGNDAVTFDYNALGQVTATTSKLAGAGKTITYGYDAGGNRTSITHPDGASFATTYDAAGAAKNASWWTSATGTVPFMAITRDNLSRRTDINRGSSYTGYGYDAVSRLTDMNQRYAQNAGNTTVTMGYNTAGQIASRSNSNDDYAWPNAANIDRSYQVNALNQYSSAGPATFAYDGRGNLTSDGTNSYGYDLENRMVSASTSGGTTLSYDPLGRLWQIASPQTGKTQFLYDGEHVVAEYDGDSGAMRRRYYWGPGADEPILQDEGGAMNCSGTRVLHGDERGSIVGVADCSGNRTQTNSYDEFGIPGPGNWGRFQYTGQAWLPEIGIYYYKARMYSPTLGRFMQTDPIGYGDGLNWYNYVGGDPVNFADPSGLMCSGQDREGKKVNPTLDRKDCSSAGGTFTEDYDNADIVVSHPRLANDYGFAGLLLNVAGGRSFAYGGGLQQNNQVASDQSKKTECVKECKWILDRPKTHPGSDRNTWEFHKCVNACMARDPNASPRVPSPQPQPANPNQPSASSWFGAALAGTVVIIGGVVYFLTTTF